MLNELVTSWETQWVPDTEDSIVASRNAFDQCSRDPFTYLHVFHHVLEQVLPNGDESIEAQHLEGRMYCKFSMTDADELKASLLPSSTSSSGILNFIAKDATKGGGGNQHVVPSGSGAGAYRNVWLLSLVCHNTTLMKATARLYVQFCDQYAVMVVAHARDMQALQAQQAEQLASVFSVAAETGNVIVDSSVTESFVAEHQQELEALQRACIARKAALECELRDSLHAVLQTSAPDAITALEAQSRSNEDSNAEAAADLAYAAIVDVSAFADYQTASLPLPPSTPAAVPTVRSVPVRTAFLENPMRRQLPHARLNDPSLQPIVVDLSPTSALRACLLSIATSPSAVSGSGDANNTNSSGNSGLRTNLLGIRSSPSSRTLAAAEEHLRRLAHAKHSMLLLIGSERAALDLLHSVQMPELLLGQGSASDVFVPLPCYESLRVMFNTRLWGANIVLLWDPLQSRKSHHYDSSDGSDGCATHEAAATPQRIPFPTSDSDAAATSSPQHKSTGAISSVFHHLPVVEDVLHLAFSWNVDMLSITVLDKVFSLTLPRSGAATASGGSAYAHTESFHHYRGHSEGMCVEVLQQLQYGLAKVLLESYSATRPELWTVQDEELLSRGYRGDVASHTCPKPVGIHKQQGVHSGSSPNTNAMRATSPTNQAYSPVSFNTPMAIRVFLPLPEAWFENHSSEETSPTAGTGASTDRGTAGQGRGRGRSRGGGGTADRGKGRGAAASQSFSLQVSEDPRASGANPTFHRRDPQFGSFTDVTGDAMSAGARPPLEQFLFYAFGETAGLF